MNANDYTMTVSLDGGAFHDDHTGDPDPGPELAAILRKAADRIEASDWHRGHSTTILDSNGNDVGRWKIHPER